ncbi:MAG: DegT/DnrJ/EryC1/StrS family aminotransferase [Bryobacteraceae bacterium]
MIVQDTTGGIGRLAIDGGSAVRTAPLPPWPYFAPDEIDAVAAVLASGKVNYWTGGEGKAFEEEFAVFCSRRYGLALANGTLALELALQAMEIGPGDEVITTCRTFIASASAVVMRGAKPVMADVDIDSQNITESTVREAITPQTRAIIAVHLAGWPCDMDRILKVASEFNLRVIEDCAQAHGATYRGKPVGSFGDAAAFSFCQDKIMTTGGEGGMLLLNDERLWQRAWSFRDHGKSYDAMFVRKRKPEFRWIHESFGTNWRITEMQSAIGRAQLRKLDDWVARRAHNAAYLNRRLASIPGVRLTIPSPDCRHAYYKYYFFVAPEQLKSGWTRDRIVAAINAEGVWCNSGHCGEIFRELAFDSVGRPERSLPVAQELFATAVMCNVHPTMDMADMRDIGDALEKVLSVALG